MPPLPQAATALSNLDTKLNIKAAYTSRDLASAARRDSSAMKSIAVLTMAFLPGTFFAALFSMPSLGWDQPRYFPLYWAYTIPFTVLTFIIWILFSQRDEIRKWARGKLPFLPLWYLYPSRRSGPQWGDLPDEDWEDIGAVERYMDARNYFTVSRQHEEAKERLKAKIFLWSLWKRDGKEEAVV